MPVPKEAVGHALEAYRKQLDTISSNEVGRPQLISAILNGLAAGAEQSIRANGGKAVRLEYPNLDVIDEDSHDDDGHPRPKPGRLVPGNNPKFISAHRRNLAALEKELALLA